MAAPGPKIASMSGADFKLRLRELGRSHLAFAAEIGASLRSVDRWASSGPPAEVAYLVDLLGTIDEIRVAADGLSFTDQLDRLMDQAAAKGQLAAFVDAVRSWYAVRHIDDFEA